MRRGWKVAVMVLAAVVIVSTPLFWLLGTPDAGQLTGASIQAAAGVVTLVWAWFQQPERRADDVVAHTGRAQAIGGGTAVTGIRRPQGRGGGSARAQDTGPATARGEDSSAVSGIEYT